MSIVPFSSNSDAEQMLALLTLTEEISSTEAEKTNAYFEAYREEMEGRFAALSEDNLRLSVALVGSTSREREIDLVHKTELEALRGKVADLEQSITDMRKEMVDTAKRADERVAAAMRAQLVAVQTATSSSYQTGFSAGKALGQARLNGLLGILSNSSSMMKSDAMWYRQRGNPKIEGWGAAEQSERAEKYFQAAIRHLQAPL